MLRRFGHAAGAIALVLMSAIAPLHAQTLPQISNTANSVYGLTTGPDSISVSGPVATQKIAFGSLLVTPKETAPSIPAEDTAIGGNATRTFTITNTSDITDAYTITSLVAGSQKIVSASFVSGATQVPLAVGSTVSPPVAPGGQIQVVVVVSTVGMTVGNAVPIDLAVRTTASGTSNGLQSDSGRQFVVAVASTTISGPGGANTSVLKTVNQTQSINSKPGTTAVFDIVAMNSGSAVATNVVVSDDVPPGVAPVAGSATIDGKPAGVRAIFKGQNVTFTIAQLAVGEKIDVAFGVQVTSESTIGSTYVNVATVSADGLNPEKTTPASILDGDTNVVFDGSIGGASPIAGAVVTLLDANGQPVNLTSGGSRAAARAMGSDNFTSNPHVTGPAGTYGFAIDPSMIGASGTSFVLTIQAKSYRDRTIGLLITPDGTNAGLFDVVATSLDSQPLARAGTFTLTSTAVTLSNVFGLFGNLPMFKNAGVIVTKVGNRTTVAPGDRIDFNIGFTNATLADIVPAIIVDTMPPGLVYAPGTAQLNGAKVEPVVDGRTLTWTIPDLPTGASGTLTYSSVVFPGVSPGSKLTNGVTVSGPPGASITPGISSFTFDVIAGPFADRRVVTGRVFADLAGSGHFQRGDRGVPGVRVYAEDGSFAVTDANGLFSFPTMRPGMHVLRIDSSTLPAGFQLFAEHRMNSTRSPMRLIHGVLDTTTMEDVEFAVEALK